MLITDVKPLIKDFEKEELKKLFLKITEALWVVQSVAMENPNIISMKDMDKKDEAVRATEIIRSFLLD